MRTRLRSKVVLLFMSLGLLLAIPATAALAADLDTDAVLNTNAQAPTTVVVGDNGFDIKVWATGTVPADKDGIAYVTDQYYMAANGTITPSTAEADQQKLQFQPGTNYSQSSLPGSQNNPFVVHANLNVAQGTPDGTTGTLKVVTTGTQGLTEDKTADTGYVKVSAPVTNGAPDQPGMIGATTNLTNTGEFTLNWGASNDPDGDSVTYTLQHKDSDDAAWSNVATKLSSPSYTFGGATNADEVEGTWSYQVQAVDAKGASSAYSIAPDLVKVDKTAPTTPKPDFSKDPEDTVGGWYKDSVTVTYKDSSDPQLIDGSAGSGVKSYTEAQPFSTSGTHDYSGVAKDGAGNESTAVSGSVKVDATYPVVGISGLKDQVVLKSSQSITVTASDAHSGLAKDPNGTVSLDTSSVGRKPIIVTAVDNVGHETLQTYYYSVIYGFSGFLQPINNTAHQTGADVSTFKAGSTVPVKFQLKDANGNVVQPAKAPEWTDPQKGSATNQAVDEDIYTLTATTGGLYKWDSTVQQYIYNWSTKGMSSGYYYKIGVKLDDGQTYYTYFSLR
jgi:hypothetical protein